MKKAIRPAIFKGRQTDPELIVCAVDQAIHNKIVSFIRGIEAKLGSRSHLKPDSRTLSVDAKRSESRDGDDHTRT